MCASFKTLSNGVCERFIRSFKEECVWAGGTGFASLAEARQTIARWIGWYNQDRPHQALGYQTPDQTYAAFAKSAA